MHASELRAVMLQAIAAEVPAAMTSIDRAGEGFDDYGARAFSIDVGFPERRAYLGYVPESEGYQYRRDQFDQWLKDQPGS